MHTRWGLRPCQGRLAWCLTLGIWLDIGHFDILVRKGDEEVGSVKCFTSVFCMPRLNFDKQEVSRTFHARITIKGSLHNEISLNLLLGFG